MNVASIGKNGLKGRIEPVLLERLRKSEYNVISVPSRDLLTWNRLDLAFKLFYLETKNAHLELAETVYQEDIRSQTLASFKEHGNDEKNTFSRYLEIFEGLHRNMELSGFDDKISLIPLSRTGSLMNGAHRVAVAAFLNREVRCVRMELEPLVRDYLYFYWRDVSPHIMDMIVNTFIKYANNTYIAFLWPSFGEHFNQLKSFFSNIVYKKVLSLNSNGLFNLLTQVYAGTPWLGSFEDGFKGARAKCMECSGRENQVIVIVFQEESLDEVRRLKAKIRDNVQIGSSSVHITDTKKEAVELGRLLFNKNSVHFLNFANPFRWQKAYHQLDRFKKLLQEEQVEKEMFVIDGSMALTMYGIREHLDIDYLALEEVSFQDTEDIGNHSSQLTYHKKTQEDLVLNPKFFFYFYGLKFTALSQLYTMKENRGEGKDVRDLKLMDSYLSHDTLRFVIERMRQKAYYLRLRTSRIMMEHIMNFLKKRGLYSSVRSIYRKLKGR